MPTLRSLLRWGTMLPVAIGGIAAAVMVTTLCTRGIPDAAVATRQTAWHRSPACPAAESRIIAGKKIDLCRQFHPAAPYPVWSVDSLAGRRRGEPDWRDRQYGKWQSYAQGEFLGHARLPYVPEYRLRVGDQLALYYLRTREILSHPYTLQVGDEILIESLAVGTGGQADGNAVAVEDGLERTLILQPDGTITLPLLGQVPAAGRTIPALRDDIEEQYKEYLTQPSITVTAQNIDTRLEDLLETVDARGGGTGGRRLQVTVAPDGRIYIPGLNSVCVQGLTLTEAKAEINARYLQTIPGIRVTPDLVERAPRFVYVLGQVQQPGRFDLTGPTTVMQAIALAGGWQVGANTGRVVIFRRGDDWRLLATMLDIRGALRGKRPTPADEIWLNDSDIVLLPKSAIQQADDIVEQVFTRGIYAAVPVEFIWGQGFGTVTSVLRN